MRITNIRQIVVPALAAVALMGCQPVWVKNDEHPEEFAQAVDYCNAPERIGFGVASGSIVREMNRRVVLARCIATFGFRQVDPHDVPPGTNAHDDVVPGVRPYRPS